MFTAFNGTPIRCTLPSLLVYSSDTLFRSPMSASIQPLHIISYTVNYKLQSLYGEAIIFIPDLASIRAPRIRTYPSTP